MTSQNVTSDLKRRAEEAWSAIRSRANTVNDADVIVDDMTRRVTLSMTSLMTSQGIRAATNMTLNDLEPLDISVELKIIGTVMKMSWEDIVVAVCWRIRDGPYRKRIFNVNIGNYV